LRAIGIVRVPMAIVIAVVVHMVLAPVLITGWGTAVLYSRGWPASTATVMAVVLLWLYFIGGTITSA
jgi:hypothetical protein